MRSVLMLGCSLLISVSVSASALAFTDNNSTIKGKESTSINRVEKVETLQLTGSVVDDKNKETLAGATIIVNGKKYYSNLEGQFTISDVNPGKYEVMVELISYEPYSIEIDITKDQNLNVELLQK